MGDRTEGSFGFAQDRLRELAGGGGGRGGGGSVVSLGFSAGEPLTPFVVGEERSADDENGSDDEKDSHVRVSARVDFSGRRR